MTKASKAITEGSKAPKFDLPTDGGGRARLADFAGAPLILYFYPKDDTAGCTREAIDFTTATRSFSRNGAKIIGVSKDTVAKHDKFKAKHDLKVILASDETGAVIESYGSWIEKTLYGRKYMGIDRSTFLIDEKGVVRRVWRKVKVPGHVEEVLAATKTLGR